MSVRGSPVVAITFDNVAGTPTVMTPYITTFNGIDVTAITQETTPFGASWVTQGTVGVKQIADITLGGFYDDTAVSGPDVVFNDPGSPAGTRTLLVGWGGTKTSSVETIISGYKRGPTVKQLTSFTVTLKPTGAITEV